MTPRYRATSITRHQEDKLSKATSYLSWETLPSCKFADLLRVLLLTVERLLLHMEVTQDIDFYVTLKILESSQESRKSVSNPPGVQNNNAS